MITAPRYPIPAETTRVEIRIVNSRFIATIGQARMSEEAREFIDDIRREFADATHNVYAFRVGYGASVIEGMSDDGEPSGTAGRPALAVLRGADLGDVVLVITRYFGGTKLGTGGLVRAYTQSTQEVLAALPRGERVELHTGQIVLPYALYEQARMLVVAHGGNIDQEDFSGEVALRVIFPADACAGFDAALAELSAGKVGIDWNNR
ncbi:MAG: YigZ family protein [Anaerolineae bacterium]|nr:YigZ family protein [Anaerolineae bacterium]